MLKLDIAKQLYNGILWSKHAHKNKTLVLATDRLVKVITGKDPHRETPVSAQVEKSRSSSFIA